MNYEEFKSELEKEVQEYYKDTAKVTIAKVWKNNGCSYDGMNIIKSESERISPVINVNAIYDKYVDEGLTLEQCVQHVCFIREQEEHQQLMSEFVHKIMKWEEVKENVYPLLIETKRNEQLLESLISTEFLDLAVIYIIREKSKDGGMFSVKLTKPMLKEYGITTEQLHQQALVNMKKDNYQLYSMKDYIKEVFDSMGIPDEMLDAKKCIPMILLTNGARVNGAVGILDSGILSGLKGNYYAILSCVHEVVFVPDNGEVSKERVKDMIDDVYLNVIESEEQLSNHVYYYNGETGEITLKE